MLKRISLISSPLLFLTGCIGQRNPTIALYGAYFPSWIACSLIGIFGAIFIRLIFIKTGIDDVLVWRLATYLSLAVAIGFASSLMIFGR